MIDQLANNLPEPLLKLPRFLVWKQFPGAKPGKTKKTPFYASGAVRRGSLDTANDLGQLVTFDEACDTYLVGGYAGIGFALTGEGVGAFDLDDCLNDAGELIASHAGYQLVQKAKAKGAYIEVSPSGRGLRIVGLCDNREAYSKGGVEYWGRGRFITLTGDVWANPGAWVDLTELRSSLGARRTRGDDQEQDEGGIITPRTIDELRDALSAFPSHERELWIRMGHALKPIGAKGKALWLEWSARSDMFDKADALAKWDGFEPTSTGYKAVFAEAQRHGWQNPRKRERIVSQSGANNRQVDLGEPKFEPTEFVLDGFMPAQVSVIAGVWGSGKSTNLLPLIASVAHLSPEDWGFRPDPSPHYLGHRSAGAGARHASIPARS